MDPNAHRSGGRRPGADAYWQRRFFTLLAGLAVIGLLAWAASGMASGGSSAHGAASGQQSAAAYSTPTTTPSSPAPVSSTPSASPTATPSASPSATPSASPSASVSAKAAQAKPKTAATGPVACPAADLLLTVTPRAASFGTKATPAFQVDIVSTDTTPCNLDTGPAALRLEVGHGSTVAYNSAVCVNGAKRHVISLRRGVPVITSMSWDKHETVNGCLSTVAAATNRTYSAMIEAGGAQSPRSSFRLTGKPATPPAKPAAKKTS